MSHFLLFLLPTFFFASLSQLPQLPPSSASLFPSLLSPGPHHSTFTFHFSALCGCSPWSLHSSFQHHSQALSSLPPQLRLDQHFSSHVTNRSVSKITTILHSHSLMPNSSCQKQWWSSTENQLLWLQKIMRSVLTYLKFPFAFSFL